MYFVTVFVLSMVSGCYAHTRRHEHEAVSNERDRAILYENIALIRHEQWRANAALRAQMRAVSENSARINLLEEDTRTIWDFLELLEARVSGLVATDQQFNEKLGALIRELDMLYGLIDDVDLALSGDSAALLTRIERIERDINALEAMKQ